jgi:hypothetical protein
MVGKFSHSTKLRATKPKGPEPGARIWRRERDRRESERVYVSVWVCAGGCVGVWVGVSVSGWVSGRVGEWVGVGERVYNVESGGRKATSTHVGDHARHHSTHKEVRAERQEEDLGDAVRRERGGGGDHEDHEGGGEELPGHHFGRAIRDLALELTRELRQRHLLRWELVRPRLLR